MRFEVEDVQFQLCEFDKYVRIKGGEKGGESQGVCPKDVKVGEIVYLPIPDPFYNGIVGSSYWTEMYAY